MNMESRVRAKEIVDRIVEAERMGGGFRSYFETATNLITEIIVENDNMKRRIKAIDELHRLAVQS